MVKNQFSKKRILFFVPLPPPVYGAALRNQSLVESKSLNLSYEIILVSFNFAKQVDDIGKFSFLKLLKFFARAYELVYKMFLYKPELVYFNFAVYGNALYRDFLFITLLKLFRSKMILHLRTQGVSDGAKKSKIKRWMYRSAFKNTHLICLSKFLSNDVREVYNHRPLIINNGILDVYDRYPHFINDGIPTILFLSNLSKSKGVLDLIKAFSIIKSKGIPFVGIIAGPESDLAIEFIETEIERENIKNCVSIIGPQYDDAKFLLLAKSDIFVFPTYFEAFPGVVLEAMQFGLPVVASIEGAIPEIVDDGNTGLLTQKQNPDDLAEKIAVLIQNKDYRKMLGSNARKKFVSHYTLSHFEESMKLAFDSVGDRNDTKP